VSEQRTALEPSGRDGLTPRMPYPLQGERVRFYFRGQNAIWHALRILHFPAGANILLPAYQCGAELDVLVRAGIEARFYRIDERMRVDFDSVRGVLDGRTRALYLTHYLGFPQDLEESLRFCADSGVALIEDCAHALYGYFQGRPLGSFGSVGIFSMRKTLPIPDGGALLVNDPRLPLPEPPCPPPITHSLRAIRSRFDDLLVHHGGPLGKLAKRGLIDPCAFVAKNISTRVAPGNWVDATEDPIPFNVQRRDWGMSPVARFLIERSDHGGVVRARRANFQVLLNALRECRWLRLVLTELPEGVCPWLFPVMVSDARGLITHLAPLGRAGIFVLGLWEEFHPRFPKERFPEATRLKTQTVALPIHHGLDRTAVENLAEQVLRWR
jgi:perosamine synthetase